MTSNTEATGVAIATTAEDAAAVDAVERHHAELSGRLSAHVAALLGAAADPYDGGVAGPARARLVAFLTDELLPHAAAEEQTLYPAAAADDRARLLVDGMVAEHRVLEGLVADLRDATDPVRAAATARSLQVLFEAHLSKENDLLLPTVAANPDVSLASVLAGMHEILGHDEDDHEPSGGCGCGGSCDCGEHDEAGALPVLDVRSVPHAIRHATVFGALEAVPAGGSLVLVAPHDPVPLLDQIRARTNGAFAVAYEERGPEAWRLRLTRQH